MLTKPCVDTLSLGIEAISEQPATTLFRVPPTPLPPGNRFGSARAIYVTLFKGGLRQRFYSDVAHFSSAPDAARQVAAGYVCLVMATVWMVSAVASGIAYPTFPVTAVLSIMNASANYLAFSRIARRQDPRGLIDWVVLLYCVSMTIAQYFQSTYVAPVVVTLPVVAAIAALYQRSRMRQVTIAIGIVAIGLCLLAALGFIGSPSTQSPAARTIMVFIGLLATMVTLLCVARMEILVRQHAHDQLRQTNDAIEDSVSRASMALEAARVGLWDVPDEASGRFLVTESFQAITGYNSEEFSSIFGNAEKFVHADDVKALRDAFALGRERMSRIRVDFRLQTKARGYRWFSARARYVKTPDGATRISGSLQDINVVKVAEETLRASRDQARAANKASRISSAS